MSKKKKTSVIPKKKRGNYEKPFAVNTSFENFIKIAVTPKEDLKPEDFGCKKD